VVIFDGLALTILDENHNSRKDVQEDTSSPSKRTKNVEEATSPSVALHRLPLSPRKDLNLSGPVCLSEGHSSAPNTLPKTATLQSSGRQLAHLRTRRNLTSSFASLTADSSSRLQQKCNSVEEIGDRTSVSHVAETDTNHVLKSTALAMDKSTPSKPCKKIGTPSKVAAKLSALSATPTKMVKTASKPELATMRLVKDSGTLFAILLLLYLLTINITANVRLLYVLYWCLLIFVDLLYFFGITQISQNPTDLLGISEAYQGALISGNFIHVADVLYESEEIIF